MKYLKVVLAIAVLAGAGTLWALSGQINPTSATACSSETDCEDCDDDKSCETKSQDQCDSEKHK